MPTISGGALPACRENLKETEEAQLSWQNTDREGKMAIYRLRRMSDLETFEEGARSGEEAVAKFSERLGVSLTLQEGDVVAQYMMALVPPGAHFAKPEDIPVYEVNDSSN